MAEIFALFIIASGRQIHRVSRIPGEQVMDWDMERFQFVAEI